jgi:hypothetical protein
MFDGAVRFCNGENSVYDVVETVPYMIFPVTKGVDDYWVYLGTTAAYVIDGLAHTEITPVTPFTGGTANQWTGGSLSGALVVTNGVDSPYAWPLTGGDMIELPFDLANSWAGQDLVVKVIRPFRNFLVALWVTKGATQYPNMVKWSHPADPGALPVSWDEADATRDAGEFELTEVDGVLVDCLPMQDSNMIYKENSTTRMQFVGGAFVFNFKTVFQTLGIIGQNCAAGLPSSQHAVFAVEDLVVHNGVQAESIATSRIRKNLFSEISSTEYYRSFVVTNPSYTEVWFCYPVEGDQFPTRAWVWNWTTGAWSKRELSNVCYAVSRATSVTPTDSTWEGTATTWDRSFRVWDAPSPSRAVVQLFGVQPAATHLKLLDYAVEGFIGAYVERQGIGIPIASGKPPDVSLRKFLRSVWPRITGAAGSYIRIHVGAQEDVNSETVYYEAVDFQIGVDVKVDVRVSGRLFALKFEAITNAAWQLWGYDLDVEISGKH